RLSGCVRESRWGPPRSQAAPLSIVYEAHGRRILLGAVIGRLPVNTPAVTPRRLLRPRGIARDHAPVRRPDMVLRHPRSAPLVTRADDVEVERVISNHDAGELRRADVVAREQKDVDLRAQVVPRADEAPMARRLVHEVMELEVQLSREASGDVARQFLA